MRLAKSHYATLVLRQKAGEIICKLTALAEHTHIHSAALETSEANNIVRIQHAVSTENV
jgi:hypothetical protein